MFSLVVGADLTQGAPTGAAVAPGAGYSGQLTVTNGTGTVSYQTTSPAISGLTVSTSGAVVGSTALAVGTYTLSGYDVDGAMDAGTWIFTLTVGNGGVLVQQAPESALVASGAGYSGQLAVSGNNGAVTYTQTSTIVSGLSVSSSGVIIGATSLAVGVYTINGVDQNGANSGSWTFTLTVGTGLPQGAPTTATVAAGTAYSGQLTVTGNTGAVTYVTTSSAITGFTVSSSGAISSATSLAVGPYTLSGTDSDTVNNSGTWTFTLTVSNSALTQTSATSATVAAGTAYSGQLTVSGATGTVAYVETTSADSTDVVVTSAGAISASASLPTGTYTVSGTESDTSSDSGTWLFALTVGTKTLEQGAPEGATVADGAGYSGQLTVTNASGTLTFTEATSANSPQVVVNSSGAVSALTSLAPGAYTVGGTTADMSGDSGTWTFTLTVNAASPPPTSGGAYDLVGSDGGVFVFGNPNGFYGSLPGKKIHVNNIVGIEPTADDLGYFLVGSDGGVFAFGDAPFENSLPGENVHVNNIVGIVPTANDQGYFLVGRDGGVFAFGNAPFENSLPGENIHVDNIVGIAATHDDGGYWLLASNGTVYALGDAAQLGSSTTGSEVSITATPSGTGYWLTSSNGTVSNYGTAVNEGSLPAKGVNVSNIVSLVPSTDGNGYLLVGRDGGLFAFGDATFPGSLPGMGVVVNNIVGAVPT